MNKPHKKAGHNPLLRVYLMKPRSLHLLAKDTYNGRQINLPGEGVLVP